jgi:hypothetical protein
MKWHVGVGDWFLVPACDIMASEGLEL